MSTKTITNYHKSVNEMIQQINKATGVEWTYMETGGGCDCLEYVTENNIYIITDGQASVPVNEANEFGLGMYHQDMYSHPEPIAEFYTTTIAECAAKFRELLAQ